jgi:hypothetical protein
MEFPTILPGKVIHVEKVLDQKKKKIFIRSNYEGLTNVDDYLRLENAERSQRRSIRGAFSHALFQKLEIMPDDAKIRVAITLKSPKGISYPIRGTLPPQEHKAYSKFIAQIRPEKSPETVLLQHGIKADRMISNFVAISTTKKSTLQKLSRDPVVSQIVEASELFTTSMTSTLILPSLFSQSTIDYVTLARSAYSHSQNNLPSNLAANVNVATFESGLNPSFVSCLGISPYAYDHMTAPFTNGNGVYIFSDSLHTLQTFTALSNSAPGANLFHRRSWSYSDSLSQDYIVENELKSVSMSVSRSSDPTALENLIVDDFVYRYPYPVFSTPAGNSGWDSVPYWGAYNAMSVGNVQDSAYEHFKVDTCHPATRTRNPVCPRQNVGLAA